MSPSDPKEFIFKFLKTAFYLLLAFFFSRLSVIRNVTCHRQNLFKLTYTTGMDPGGCKSFRLILGRSNHRVSQTGPSISSVVCLIPFFLSGGKYTLPLEGGKKQLRIHLVKTLDHITFLRRCKSQNKCSF